MRTDGKPDVFEEAWNAREEEVERLAAEEECREGQHNWGWDGAGYYCKNCKANR